ncbi:MAG: T9SS type A sorting domain-containing protein, partial [Bacteroidia bacterium]|nr:T9SS type A sorting domain-containing protein [Bacteroidia bacterium]
EVYPNPFNDQIQIQFQLVDFDITQTQLKVTDILGRIISNIPIYETQGTVYLGKSLSTGLYLLQIIDASKRSKVVKVMKVE